jgi:hypothetical protein
VNEGKKLLCLYVGLCSYLGNDKGQAKERCQVKKWKQREWKD